MPSRSRTLLPAVALTLLLAGCAPTVQPVPVYPAPTSDVEEHVAAAGLQILPKEGTKLHIHSHLGITVDGRRVTVPADIGIDTRRPAYSELHTHDSSGILHVESARGGTFTLGQLMTEWGVPGFGADYLGSYHNGQGKTRVYLFVNGKRYTGDFRRVVLRNREDIGIVITTDGTTPRAPQPFRWPSQY